MTYIFKNDGFFLVKRPGRHFSFLKRTGRHQKVAGPARVFFFGLRIIMLGMTFNYPVLWVRVKGHG